MDLEMHTVHLPKLEDGEVNESEFFAAAVGIMFDTSNHDAVDEGEEEILTRFFDSLNWEDDQTDPIVSEIPYGEVMNMVNSGSRWTYRGSVTTPPCATLVYWNVIRKVYPISQKHLDLFKKQMARGKDETNFRAIQTIDKHNLFIVQPAESTMDDDVNGWMIAAVIFIVLTVLMSAFAIILKMKSKSANVGNASNYGTAQNLQKAEN